MALSGHRAAEIGPMAQTHDGKFYADYISKEEAQGAQEEKGSSTRCVIKITN